MTNTKTRFRPSIKCKSKKNSNKISNYQSNLKIMCQIRVWQSQLIILKPHKVISQEGLIQILDHWGLALWVLETLSIRILCWIWTIHNLLIMAARILIRVRFICIYDLYRGINIESYGWIDWWWRWRWILLAY